MKFRTRLRAFRRTRGAIGCRLIAAAFLLVLFFAAKSSPLLPVLLWSFSPGERLTAYVDPFIGTGDQGHTYPGATVPFGMVQLSPDNGFKGWMWCSGYHRNSTSTIGFSHTHPSGTGMHDLQDLRLLPTTAAFNTKAPLQQTLHDLRVDFSHADEAAAAGFYRVKLSSGVQVELTTTERTGMHRYTFPAPDSHDDTTKKKKKQNFGVVMSLGFQFDSDLGHPAESLINATSERNTFVKGYTKTTGWANDHRVYFAIEFSRPWVSAELLGDEGAVKGTKVKNYGLAAGYFTFDPFSEGGGDPGVVLVKVGLSSASLEGAEESLRGENPGWNFDAVRAAADAAWEAELEKVRVESGDEGLKRTFYTALYHSKLAPTIHSDIRGEYKGADNKVHRAEGFTYYSTFSIWDTFRAAHPLFTILNPDRMADMIQTILTHADHAGGTLPIWALAGCETNTMPGYHAAVMVLEAIRKGFIRGEEVKRAYKAMKLSSANPERGLHYMERFGYVPGNMAGASVTVSLELGYDDWCTAQVAELLGKTADARHYYNRSDAYRRVFDAKTGFMRAKMSDGSWREDFNPFLSRHNNGDYTEGNAWQHTWFVPHNVPGLIDLYGGPPQFEAKLDELFTADSHVDGGAEASPDISGMIGQYAHGNEPSHHVAYLYNYAGVQHKTQARVREIMATMYSPTPEGLSGNEDCGQMSAWYVFSALGFYPVNPAEARYQLGSPLFDRAVVAVGDGKSFEVRAPGASNKAAVFVRKATLNGKVLERTFIEHAEVMAGGVLELEMSKKPPLGSVETKAAHGGSKKKGLKKGALAA